MVIELLDKEGQDSWSFSGYIRCGGGGGQEFLDHVSLCLSTPPSPQKGNGWSGRIRIEVVLK